MWKSLIPCQVLLRWGETEQALLCGWRTERCELDRKREREIEQETRRESMKMSSLINQSQATIRMKCTSYTDYIELSVDRMLTKNDNCLN